MRQELHLQGTGILGENTSLFVLTYITTYSSTPSKAPDEHNITLVNRICSASHFWRTITSCFSKLLESLSCVPYRKTADSSMKQNFEDCPTLFWQTLGIIFCLFAECLQTFSWRGIFWRIVHLRPGKVQQFYSYVPYVFSVYSTMSAVKTRANLFVHWLVLPH